MNLKKIVIFGIVNFFLINTIFSQNIDVKEIVNPEYYNQLMENGFVRLVKGGKEEKLELLPENFYKTACIKNKVVKDKGSYPFITESLYYESKKNIFNGKEKVFDVEDISKIFRSISKMEGLEYYSLILNKKETLYKSAYMVDDPKSKNRIPDPIENSISDETYYFFQNDVTFGKTYYKAHYQCNNKNTFYMALDNCESMGLGFIKAIDPDKLKMNIIFIDCGDGLLLYLQTDTECKKFPNIDNILEKLLVSRIEALKGWFFVQLLAME